MLPGEYLLRLVTGLQVLLSGADPGELVALRDALNAALLRAMGRPLKPLEPNVLAPGRHSPALQVQATGHSQLCASGTAEVLWSCKRPSAFAASALRNP